jgi:hypothetical protein
VTLDKVQRLDVGAETPHELACFFAHSQTTTDDSGFEVERHNVEPMAVPVLKNSMRTAVYTRQANYLDIESSFLFHLTDHAFRDAFARLEMATWQTPLPIVGSAREKETSIGIKNSRRTGHGKRCVPTDSISEHDRCHAWQASNVLLRRSDLP